MIKKIRMENLMCSSCAAKITKKINELDYVHSANFNMNTHIMICNFEEDTNLTGALREIKYIVDSIEDGVITYYPGHKNISHQVSRITKYYMFFIGFVAFIIGYLFDNFLLKDNNFTIYIYWFGYITIVHKISKQVIKGFKTKNYFNENVLMLIATFSAMIIAEYFEGMFVIVFFTLGEYLQHHAVEKSKNDVSNLIDLQIEYANVLENDTVVLKNPSEININDIILVKNGERIPIDGIVIDGTSSLNTSTLTGESKLLHVTSGDTVLSGYINTGEILKIKVLNEYSNSTISKIIDLIENSTNKKTETELLITKFTKVYTPFVTFLALLMFLLPTLYNPSNYNEYIIRSATFLVASCPCAIVLSVPLSYFAGIGASAKKGILFKGSSFLDKLPKMNTIAFDKTGTLTNGYFTIEQYTDLFTLQLIASLEKYSNHPIAKSITKYAKQQETIDFLDIHNVVEIPGFGIEGYIDGEHVIVGGKKIFQKYNISYPTNDEIIGTSVMVAMKEKYIGNVILVDQIKESAVSITKLFNSKYNTIMLTGDNEDTAKYVAKKLNNIPYYSTLLPHEKIEKFNEIKTKNNDINAYVGDGINDAPLLNQADIGIAMGSGSDVALDVADIIIMNEDLNYLNTAIKIATKTRNIVIENITLAIMIKALFLIAAGFGLANMVFAIFADVGITIICIINALRLIYIPNSKIKF